MLLVLFISSLLGTFSVRMMWVKESFFLTMLLCTSWYMFHTFPTWNLRRFILKIVSLSPGTAITCRWFDWILKILNIGQVNILFLLHVRHKNMPSTNRDVLHFSILSWIGSLNWSAYTTRPDFPPMASFVAQQQTYPSPDHLESHLSLFCDAYVRWQ